MLTPLASILDADYISVAMFVTAAGLHTQSIESYFKNQALLSFKLNEAILEMKAYVNN